MALSALQASKTGLPPPPGVAEGEFRKGVPPAQGGLMNVIFIPKPWCMF